jgi:hypothetical protein
MEMLLYGGILATGDNYDDYDCSCRCRGNDDDDSDFD